MLDPADRKIELGKLKARRNLLFESFVEHPSDFHLSLEIKNLDDQIAALTECRESKNGTER